MKCSLRPLLLTALVGSALLLISITAVAQMPVLPPLPGTGQQIQPSDPDKFTFLVAGDNRPAHASDPQSKIPGEIFAAAKGAGAAFVIWTGDSIYGKNPGDGTKIQAQYQEFLGIAATAGVPVYNAPGNHEMDDSNDVPNDQMRAWYIQYMAPQYGAVNLGNSRFIALNSEQLPPASTDSSGKNKEPGYVSDAQMKLLKNDLKANVKMAHIFVFMHHPLEPFEKKDGFEKDNGKALKKLLEKYPNVSFVFSGHEHMYFNPQGKEGTSQPPSRKDPSSPPTYIVTGGAGAPLKNAEGGFYNYMTVNVDHDKVSAKMVKVE